MPPNLEGQLGELTGHIRALVPVLDKVEERQNQADKKAAAAEAKHDALRAEFTDNKKSSSNHINALYKKNDGVHIENETRKNEIATVSREVDLLKSRYEGVGKKIWDIIQIIVTVVITVIVTKTFGR